MQKQEQLEIDGIDFLSRALSSITTSTIQNEKKEERIVSAEEAYKRLENVMELERKFAEFDSQTQSTLMLKPEKSDEYFKEIIEGGGAPSILEITKLAAELKTAQHYSSVYKFRKYARDNLAILTG